MPPSGAGRRRPPPLADEADEQAECHESARRSRYGPCPRRGASVQATALLRRVFRGAAGADRLDRRAPPRAVAYREHRAAPRGTRPAHRPHPPASADGAGGWPAARRWRSGRGLRTLGSAGGSGGRAREGTLGHHRAPRPLRPAVVLVAAVLAIALGVAPSTARPVLAAEPLRTQADTVYTIDPAAGRVHVAIAITATNLKPNSAAVHLLLPPARLRAAARGDGRQGLRPQRRPLGDDEAARPLHRGSGPAPGEPLLPRHHDLHHPLRPRRRQAPLGFADPRRRGVRVVRDLGVGRPRPEHRRGPHAAGLRQPVRRRPDDARRLRPGPGAPRASPPTRRPGTPASRPRTGRPTPIPACRFQAGWRSSSRPGPRMTSGARPSAPRCARRCPSLRSLIGLPWPVEHDLDVRERFTPLLEGYAGVFLVDEQRIDVSEDLDPIVIVHEASHAWLNNDLFVERWIYEGLAQEYAWRVQSAVGADDGGLPTSPGKDDPGLHQAHRLGPSGRDPRRGDRRPRALRLQRLVLGGPPDREVGGRRADEGGIQGGPGQHDGLRRCRPRQRRSPKSDGWKRLLDLIEGIDTTSDRPELEQALRDFVLTSPDATALGAREKARGRTASSSPTATAGSRAGTSASPWASGASVPRATRWTRPPPS